MDALGMRASHERGARATLLGRWYSWVWGHGGRTRRSTERWEKRGEVGRVAESCVKGWDALSLKHPTGGNMFNWCEWNFLATEEAAVVASGQLRCGPETHRLGDQQAVVALTPSASLHPLEFKETAGSSLAR